MKASHYTLGRTRLSNLSKALGLSLLFGVFLSDFNQYSKAICLSVLVFWFHLTSRFIAICC